MAFFIYIVLVIMYLDIACFRDSRCIAKTMYQFWLPIVVSAYNMGQHLFIRLAFRGCLIRLHE